MLAAQRTCCRGCKRGAATSEHLACGILTPSMQLLHGRHGRWLTVARQMAVSGGLEMPQPAASPAHTLLNSSPAFLNFSCSHRELPPLNAKEVVAAVLPLPGASAALLALSANCSLLAVASGSAVHIYSTQQLMTGDTAALAVRRLGGEVVQLAWRPGEAADEFAVLLADGSLLLGGLASGDVGAAPLAPRPPSIIRCVAWSPDGSRLAVGAADQVLMYAAPTNGGGGGWRQTAAVRVLSIEAQDADMLVEVDALSWVTPSAILVSSRLLALGEEEPVAPLCMLSWREGAADPAADTVELAGATLPGSLAAVARAAFVTSGAERAESTVGARCRHCCRHPGLCRHPSAPCRVLRQQHLRMRNNAGALAAGRHRAAGARPSRQPHALRPGACSRACPRHATAAALQQAPLRKACAVSWPEPEPGAGCCDRVRINVSSTPCTVLPAVGRHRVRAPQGGRRPRQAGRDGEGRGRQRGAHGRRRD